MGNALGSSSYIFAVTYLCEKPFKIEWYIAIINIGVWFFSSFSAPSPFLSIGFHYVTLSQLELTM